jgi:polysaccharide deacetylase family protein (PEP-CTERM system associated)
MTPRISNALTIDVEDYFQVEAFADVVSRTDWPRLPSRVEANTDRLLALFDQAGVSGTFFTLGWVAERCPALVRRIADAGHELASHGFMHARVDRQTRQEFRADIDRARKLLEDTGGVRVTGYRAPTFSIGAATPWAADVLLETGHRYSSSVYPIRHDLYGAPDAPRFPYQARPGLWELPMTTIRARGHNLPCSGGGFFRLLPYPVFRLGLRRFNQVEAQPGLFYLHPWEIDPGQPAIRGARLRSRLRHRINLGRTEPRLRRLLSDFAWTRVDQAFPQVLEAEPPSQRQGQAAA